MDETHYFQVYLFCIHCEESCHQYPLYLGTKLTPDQDKEIVMGDHYQGIHLSEIWGNSDMNDLHFNCPNEGKALLAKNSEDIFLVRVEAPDKV